MNIENLKEDWLQNTKKEYKYKDLIDLLEVENKSSGKSRNYQFEDWNRYFNFYKPNPKGQKFIITEIFTIPKPKVNNRGVKYTNKIEQLILNLVPEEEVLEITNKELKLALSMININYNYFKYNRIALADYLDLEINLINEFFDINNRNLNDAIIRALDNLQSQEKIIWENNIVLGTKIEGKSIHLVASAEEKEEIIKIENKVMLQLSTKYNTIYSSKTDIYLARRYTEFKNNVDKLLEEIGIYYYYSRFTILKMTKNDKLDSKVALAIKKELNDTIIINLIKNTEKRHLKKYAPSDNKYKVLEIERRKHKYYVKDTIDIANTIININTQEISQNELLDRISVNKITQDIIDSSFIDSLFGE